MQYVRQVTVDLTRGSSQHNASATRVHELIRRFQQVSAWVAHVIIAQQTHDDRKAVLSCLLRLAQTCWNLGSFNTATQIVAGLK